MAKKIVTITVIVLLALTVFTLGCTGQPEKYTNSKEVLEAKESSLEVMVSSTDPVQERLQEIATDEYYSLESRMFMISDMYYRELSMNDFCSNLVVSEPSIDALTQKPMITLQSQKGFYAGPILFLDKDGSEVKLIRSAVVTAGNGLGLSVDAGLSECEMITIREVNPYFKERFIYLNN